MKRQGFSLVEAIIAMAILSVVLAAIAPLFISYSQTNLQSQRRTEAVAIAQMEMDGLRKKPFANWPASGSVQSVPSGQSGNVYNVRTSYCTAELPYCDSGARHIKVEVIKDGRTYYQVETVYTQF